jgi:bacterioferritin-associated ferredoxin
MIPVALAPGLALVCGECVTKAAALVAEEQARRAADANALRGQDASTSP